jgi:hypothetical protein
MSAMLPADGVRSTNRFRARVEATAAEYTEARHAALDGEERNVASTAAQDALEQYAGWTLGEWKPADFPRLAGNA